MKKLSNINESAWGEMRHRSSGQIIRKEDDITNIKSLEPVDMGVSVLWADRDLEYKDENDPSYFTYEEVEDIVKKSEWRIPTKNEFYELYKYTRMIKNTDEVFVTEGDFDDSPQLIFYKKGYMYGDNPDTINHISHYCAWTSTPYEPEGYYMIEIEHHQISKFVPMHKENKICVRLVKDRK
jgi:hypothetical protein